MRGRHLRNTFTIAVILVLTIILDGQGCSRVRFGIQSLDNGVGQINSQAAGNGGTYDGKLIIVHNIEPGFTCEGKELPYG